MGARIPDAVVDAAARRNMVALWESLCADPQLAGLPFKFETTLEGKIIMRPASMPHASMQGRIMFSLQAVARDAGLGGEVMPECPVVTAGGVKVPDVVWLSRGQADAFAGKTAAPAAPDICVQIKSPSNSKKEMDAKRALYFGAGAKEVWICDEQGTLTFWSAAGKIRRSRILAAFPARVGST